MTRITEQELTLPALYVISEQPGITTTELIAQLRELLNPTGEDAELLEGRNDDKFSQKVRNLVSHHVLDGRLGYTILTPTGNNNSSHTITQKGLDYLKDKIDALVNILSNSFSYVNTIDGISKFIRTQQEGNLVTVLDENIIIKEGTTKTTRTRIYERSLRLRELAVSIFTQNGRIVCQACGFDFFDSFGELGKGFIEIHHEKPIYLYENEDIEVSLREALSNVRPLCSNCHRIIHRNKCKHLTVEKLIQVLIKQGKI